MIVVCLPTSSEMRRWRVSMGALMRRCCLLVQFIEVGVGLLQVLVGWGLDAIGLGVRLDEPLVVEDREAHVGIDHRRGRRRGLGALGRGRRRAGGVEDEHAHGDGKDAREQHCQCERLAFHVVLSKHVDTAEVWSKSHGHV